MQLINNDLKSNCMGNDKSSIKKFYVRWCSPGRVPVLIWLALMSLSACNSKNTDGHSQGKGHESGNAGAFTLLDTEWQLVELNGKTIGHSENMTSKIYLKFDSSEERLQGFAACNNFTATYSFSDNNSLNIGMLASTKRACPFMMTEVELLKLLERVNKYEHSGNTLVLYNENTKAEAKFTSTP